MNGVIKSTKRARKKRVPKTEFEKIQEEQKRYARRVFRSVGFTRFSDLSDQEFEVGGQHGDVDDVFVYENIVICVEYTASKSANVGAHLKAKKVIFDKIGEDSEGFIESLQALDPAFKAKFDGLYESDEIIVRLVYASRYSFDDKYKAAVPDVAYLDYPALRYFVSTTDSIKVSAKHELFDFLGVSEADIGINGIVSAVGEVHDYKGLLLPHGNSSLPKNFQVVSFYVDPASLLKRSYVLRKYGWKDDHHLYQRMISKAKVEGLRKYLKSEGRVFLNNIIASLPSGLELAPIEGVSGKLKQAIPVKFQLPNKTNSIGLIDGQHRTFCYYESLQDDEKIATLRGKQNLLVTGIIFPEDLSEKDREKFEARLFKEINSNQTKVRSDLIHAIDLVLDPFSDGSIATKVLARLNNSGGPLSGQVEQHFFDRNKLKTVSIVRYGLKSLVKTSGADSIFSIWDDSKRESLLSGDYSALDEYIKFSVAKIDIMLAAVRNNVDSSLWTSDRKVRGRMLTTTKINAMLILLRLVIESGHSIDFEYLSKKLRNLKPNEFEKYHSSRYRMMAKDIYETHF